MSLKTQITDSKNGLNTSVCKLRNTDGSPNGTENGVIVATDTFHKFNGKTIPFTNADHGIAMNQDGAFGGTALTVNTGENGDWNAADVVGTKLTAESADRANSPTLSTKIDNPAINDVWEWDKGSNQILTGYVATTMFINVDKDWTTDSIELYAWDGTAEVGNRVKLEDYFSENEFDVWHALIIPFGDMGIVGETIQSLRMQLVTKSGGKSPKFYVDDIQLEQTGEAIEYRVVQADDSPYHIYSFRVALADDLASSTVGVPALTYNKLLGLTKLTNGITFRRFTSGVQVSQFTMTDLFDFFTAGFHLTNGINDGSNTAICLDIVFDDPIILDGNAVNDYISVTISDDLSGLAKFTVTAKGSREI